MENAKYLVDMHCHTVRSDGCDTPGEFVKAALSRGMKAVAIADHDIRPPSEVEIDGETIPLSDIETRFGLIVVPATEISCDTDVEDVHVLGYACDWNDPFFDRMERAVIDSKIESYQVLIERLNEDGIAVRWEDILERNGITAEEIQKKYIFEEIAHRGYTETWQDAKLLVKRTKKYNINRKKPDPVETIGEIHRCGGLAVLAHPYLITDPPYEGMTRDRYIDRLIDAGLDGIEVSYTYDKTSYGGTLTKEQIIAEVEGKYRGRVTYLTGGSDYHGDHKKGVENAREIGECGLVFGDRATTEILSKFRGVK
ncbi:PHP domain-containing protein [Oscillospiraceae bacterium OttesenSCG-928-G22]|nr:PHP domain-containing protein [Oscillospiraceae bacterium OttesenSCG-928-G22]